MSTNNTDPLFTNNSYVNFDATSINELIISRLNENKIFTDQNFQGSNLSSLLDVISYTFSTLLYYLNKTSSETMFSEAQIYENMNRIVKLLNYNPKGYLTQTVGYNINASLLPDNYMIPRYSYLKVGSITFSFTKDIYFTFLEDKTVQVQNPENDYFLFQGRVQEYPIYTALGAINEILFINLGNTVIVDHNNIHVYVQYANTDTWVQWNQTSNLFLNKSNDEVFEIRYNPNKNYEIKFGDNINGKQLNTDDKVLVYYLAIDVNASTIASNALKNSKIIPYNSLNYLQIQKDTVKFPATILDSTNLSNVTLVNNYPSNAVVLNESVEQIRKNAPKSFSYQQRLVTAYDFQNYIKDNYSNILTDCYVVNNEDYLKGHMKYLYDIGIKSPQLDNSILYNQIKFANSCNFNNIYAYIVPNNGSQKYATTSQKELILNDIQSQKIMTCDVIPMDPVYMSFDFYINSPRTKANVDDLNYNSLLIYKTKNTRQSNSGIINSVIEIIKKAFSKDNVTLGQFIDISQISSDIANLEGVDYIKTYRSDINTYVDGLSLLVWNTAYPSLDCVTHSHNFGLQYFQYPTFNNIDNLINKIKIIETSGSISITDY